MNAKQAAAGVKASVGRGSTGSLGESAASGSAHRVCNLEQSPAMALGEGSKPKWVSKRKEWAMRSIIISAIAISLIGVAPQIAWAKQTYVVQQWPEDIAKVPCSAFKRHPNGTWTEVAVFDLHGNRFTGNTYPLGSREVGMLDQKCGAK
jgi:hypothetical protein